MMDDETLLLALKDIQDDIKALDDRYASLERKLDALLKICDQRDIERLRALPERKYLN